MSFETGYKKLEEIYENYLTTIREIKFTFREIDVTACIINNRGEKKIASLLSISPRTVSAHVYNIMNKLGCNSKDQIIDFIETSGKLLHFKQYYLHLILKADFEKHLTKIGKQLNRHNLRYVCDPNKVKDNLLYQSIEKHFNLANITLLDVNNNSPDLPIVDISEITENNYHYDILNYLQKLIVNPEIDVIIKEFNSTYKSVEESYSGSPLVESANTSNFWHIISNMTKTRKIILLAIACVLILLVIVLIRNLITENTHEAGRNIQIPEIINQLTEFSADNITKEQSYKNQSIVKQIEKILAHSENKAEMQKYFANTEISANKLVNYLYGLRALANYYTYNEHNGTKARHLLLYAKDLAESYVSSRSNVVFEFQQLELEEILSELEIIKDLPEIYTRIVYTLGRTHLYQGDKDEGSRYFEVAKYLGNKLNLFEGYLSDRSGFGIIMQYKATLEIKNNNLPQAIKILQESIQLYKNLQSDNKMYIINYKPDTKDQSLIMPGKDTFNLIECIDRVIENNIKLIKIADDSKKAVYLQEITDQLKGHEEFPGVAKFNERHTISKNGVGI